MGRSLIQTTVSRKTLERARGLADELRMKPKLSEQANGAKLVLFLDMLGFKNVTNFSGFTHSKMPPKSTMRHFGIRRLPWSDRYNSASDVYSTFQRIIRAEIQAAQKRRKAVSPLTSIVFSDSLYMVFTSPKEIIRFTTTTMLRMMVADIPVRMGIGFGHVVRNNFTSETFPSNDIILSAPFMGNGIVSAYMAEQSRHKGLRILVDGPAASVIRQEGLGHFLMLIPGADWPECRHELNYLSTNIAPVHESIVPFRVNAMKAFAPGRAKSYYTETNRVVKRMSKALKTVAELKKLRRRRI